MITVRSNLLFCVKQYFVIWGKAGREEDISFNRDLKFHIILGAGF